MKSFNYFNNNNQEIDFPTDDVVYFKIIGQYLYAFTKDGENMKVDIYISGLESSLPTHFVRVNEDVIVNRRFLREGLQWAHERLVVVMDDVKKSSFIVSAHYYDNAKLNLMS